MAVSKCRLDLYFPMLAVFLVGFVIGGAIFGT